MKTKREFSAGGCVFKRLKIDDKKSKLLWLVGEHSGYHKWVLPKGMIEEGETEQETAIRETREEMGVETRVVGEGPIHEDTYWFVAELDKKKASEKIQPIRRVKTYQENPEFEKSGEKVKVHKTVVFFLMEAVGGAVEDHGWEMSRVEWVSYEEAMERLVFEGERRALEIAGQMVG